MIYFCWLVYESHNQRQLYAGWPTGNSCAISCRSIGYWPLLQLRSGYKINVRLLPSASKWLQFFKNLIISMFFILYPLMIVTLTHIIETPFLPWRKWDYLGMGTGNGNGNIQSIITNFSFLTFTFITKKVTVTKIVTLTQIVTTFLASRKCDYYMWGKILK